MTNKSEDERIRDLETHIKGLDGVIADLRMGLAPLQGAATEPAFGTVPLSLILSPLLTRLPIFPALSSLVNEVASGPCGSVVFKQNLAAGSYFITVTNEGDCKVVLQQGNSSGDLHDADPGGVGGGYIKVANTAEVSAKCQGTGDGECNVRISLQRIPAQNVSGVWAKTSATSPACNATPLTQQLPVGNYHVTVKNTGASCSLVVNASGSTFGNIPPGGGIGGGSFTVGPDGGRISVKCSGAGGQGPCSFEYTLTRV